MTASAVRPPDLVPVHVGYPAPTPAPDIPRPVFLGSSGSGGVPMGGRVVSKRLRQSLLTDAGVDWQRHSLEPRWVGMESADCAAALQPSVDQITGSAELGRYLAGAAERGETALVVTMLGYVEEEARHPLAAVGGDTVYLPGLRNSISGSRLPAGTRPRLAENVTPVDRDLGLRLLNRPSDAPWWRQKLSGLTMQGLSGPPTTHAPDGELQPILVDALGAPVVGVWVSPDGQQRWYLVPDIVDWNSVLDWLVQQALPAYAPAVLRRFRTASFVDPALLTPDEAAARQGIADMEARHVEERTRLVAELARAQQEADPVRYGLLYGTGSTLVEAVDTVLTAAGFTTVDLDNELGGPRSADLLATLGQHRRLVEVKAASGSAGENLVGDLQRHLDTWPELRPQLPVGGGALIVNHQHKRPPDQRTRQLYTRPEFIKTLTVQVVPARELFDWWKDSDWTAIQHAVLGRTTSPTSGTTTATSTAAHSTAPSPTPTSQAKRTSWFRKGSRT